VGVLALVQVFPPGLTTLRNNSAALLARSLADAENERIAANKDQIPDYIATVQHVLTPTGLAIIVDASKPTRELMPPKDPAPAPGQLDGNGNIVLASGSIGDWERLAASNRISRVLGESHKVGAPQPVGADYGSLVQMNFAPLYYFLLPSGVGEPGFLQVYGNEMARRLGDRKAATPAPVSFNQPKDWEFFFVDRTRTDAANFPGEDQIWLGPATTKDVRIALSFVYSGAVGPEQYDSVFNVSLDPAAIPAYAAIVDNFWVISLQQLVGQPDIYGRVLYNPASVLSVYRDSVRVQRLFQEIPITTPFTAGNPYQYKALNANFGTILVNPAAYDYNVKSDGDQTVPLRATADYTVYDWRILKDEFRLPQEPGDVKLIMSSIKPLNGSGPDGRRYQGFGFDVPTLDPTGLLEVRGDDFVLMDVNTGGIILGNMPDATNTLGGYSVDKTHGYLHVRDTQAGGLPLEVPVAYATGDSRNPWSVVLQNVAGHAVRALYEARGEWSVQMYRAAADYRVTDIVAANGLQASECYVGGSVSNNAVPVGMSDRLYFPLSDLGQRVNVGEIWYTDNLGVRHVLRDQNLLIENVENLLGIDHAYADLFTIIGAKSVFDFSNGYAVRRVRGASMTLRVLHNNSIFNLSADPVANYDRLELWSRNWKRSETESYVLGGGK
ncbi:MAG TPA: hypothetical protein VNI20_01265, partial [Fimbriimonadaceae bacterium]|nr:hypothetical protein [Fimbriimonadaceae bacterium]